MIDQVRLLIPDTDPDNQIFTDEDVENFLLTASGSVWRAGALAILAVANNEALLLKHVRTDDLAVNGPAVADALRKTAEIYFDRADKEDAQDVNDAFRVIPTVRSSMYAPEYADSWNDYYNGHDVWRY